MLVDESNVGPVVERLSHSRRLGIDSETTGLHIAKDRLFSLIIADLETSYYFDVNHKDRKILQRLRPLFAREDIQWDAANAKYDMHMLSHEGLFLSGPVHCSNAKERVIKNNRMRYNLNDNAKNYLGETKDEAVEDYISAHKLWTKAKIPGKKKEEKLLHFDKVPLEIAQPYGEKDAKLHLRVGIEQDRTLDELDKVYGKSSVYGSIKDVAANEVRLTKTCFRMESRGIKIDPVYTQKALAKGIQRTYWARLPRLFKSFC